MRFHSVCLALIISTMGFSPVLAEPLWRMLTPVDKVEASPSGEYTLTQENGPWLVMAATFSGDEGEEQARELVLELRQHYNLSAYFHGMTFDHSADGERLGRGLDQYGATSRMRYQSGDRSQEYAVLVGNFASIDDPEAQRMLDRIKTLRPKALSGDLRESSQNLAQEREYLARLQGTKGAPPMHKAFLTRNPTLPAEYFKPKGVDPFVAKMNSGVQYSLLDCKGKYTVQIATFRGKAILQGAMTSGNKTRGKKKKAEVDPLVVAAENAHDLTQFLRAKGWEAFEFHDRTESYVTVGSYDEVVEMTAQGPQPTREIQIIMHTFGAAYQTPAALDVNKPLPLEDSFRAERVKQQFNNLFSSEHGQIAQGLQPKYISPVPGKFVPLDVNPEVIEAPKRSVTSAYAWQRK